MSGRNFDKILINQEFVKANFGMHNPLELTYIAYNSLNRKYKFCTYK